MERRVLFTWLIGISFVGILCIFTLGRPTSDISTAPVGSGYTRQPGGATLPPDVVAGIATDAAANAGAATTVTPVVDPRSQEVATDPPTATELDAQTTPTVESSAAFSPASVLNSPLRESIGKIAANMPGSTIRPYPLGTTLPPGVAVQSRVNLEYDPSTLVVSKVTYG